MVADRKQTTDTGSLVVVGQKCGVEVRSGTGNTVTLELSLKFINPPLFVLILQ